MNSHPFKVYTVNSHLADTPAIMDTLLVRTIRISPAETTMNCIDITPLLRTLAVTALRTLVDKHPHPAAEVNMYTMSHAK